MSKTKYIHVQKILHELLHFHILCFLIFMYSWSPSRPPIGSAKWSLIAWWTFIVRVLKRQISLYTRSLYCSLNMLYLVFNLSFRRPSPLEAASSSLPTSVLPAATAHMLQGLGNCRKNSRMWISVQPRLCTSEANIHILKTMIFLTTVYLPSRLLTSLLKIDFFEARTSFE